MCESFTWSGRNRFADRFRAAEQLAHRLRELEADEHISSVILVGHSHGGNIALDAMSRASVAKTAVVTLSTPFLHYSRRSLVTTSRMQIAFTTALAICTGFLWLWLSARSPAADLPLWAKIALFVATFALIYFLASELIRRSRTVGAELFQHIDQVSPSRRGRVLALKTPADEASLALSLPVLANFVVQRLYGPLEKMIRVLEQDAGSARSSIAAWFGMLAGIVVLAGALYLYTGIPHRELGLVALIAIAMRSVGANLWRSHAPRAFSAIGCLLLSVLAIPVAAVMGLIALPFGPEAIICSLTVEVSAESSPPGSATIVSLSPRDQGGLRHSQLYSDDRVPEIIAKWFFATS